MHSSRGLSSLRSVEMTKKRNDVLRIARAEIGVRELTGKNDGVRVEQYLRYTGLPKGYAWCASYISWVFGQAGFSQPRTAWSPALFPKGRVVGPSSRTAGRTELASSTRPKSNKCFKLNLLVKHSSRDLSILRDDETLKRDDEMLKRDDEVLKGLVFGIYFKDLGRIAHVGLVEMDRGNYIQTIEGNTALDGDRDGNGVFRRLRLKRTICKYADWLN